MKLVDFYPLGLSDYCLHLYCYFHDDNSPKTLNDKNHQASSEKFRQLIYSRYRPNTIYEWKQLEKLNQKLAWMMNHLTFLCRCWELKRVQQGLTIKIPVHFNWECKTLAHILVDCLHQYCLHYFSRLFMVINFIDEIFLSIIFLRFSISLRSSVAILCNQLFVKNSTSFTVMDLFQNTIYVI